MLPETNGGIDELFFDANCLFHPKCQEIAKEYSHLINTNQYSLESKMIKNIIDYIDYIIDYIKPNKVVYIAIDGVAPMAKIKHQRLRRFKSIRDYQIMDSIAKKHKKEVVKHWNSNCITPGTLFMKKIFIAINKYIKTKKENGCEQKYIFSSCNIPGEGEHKIMDYINNHLDKENTRFCVYGLDADLIFLSMATNVPKLYLLREVQNMETGTPIVTDRPQFNLVCIPTYRKVVIDDMLGINVEDIKIDINWQQSNETSDAIVRDYIFICYLLGNDFIPNLPSTNLRNLKEPLNGLENILRNYRLILREKDNSNTLPSLNYNIIEKIANNKFKINREFFLKLLEYLTEEEEEYFVKDSHRKNKSYMSKCESNDPYDIELNNLHNLQFKIDDPIKLADNLIEGKKRYYIHYFGDIDLDLLCYEYIKGLYWILYYYYDKPNTKYTTAPNWLWFFPWHHAPFVSDLYNYVKKISDEDWNKLADVFPSKNTFYGTIKPLTQLLLVLPQPSSFLLPKEYKKIITSDELKRYFPKIFEQDLLFKNKFWQAIPKIPILEYPTVRKFIETTELTDDELYRNKQFKLLIY